MSRVHHIPLSKYEIFDDYKINVPCGLCIHCLKSYQSEWRVRLLQHWRTLSPSAKRRCYFLTFTINPLHYDLALSAPAVMVRSFCENYRRYFGHSVNHWFVTEFGEDTDRLHFHALLFDCDLDFMLSQNRELLWQLWSDNCPPRPTVRNLRLGLLESYIKRYPPSSRYGFIKVRRCTVRRVNYITSYITKGVDQLVIDKDHKQKVFSSPGLGRSYVDNHYNRTFAKPTEDSFNLTTHGFALPYTLPRYWRRKLFTDKELSQQTMYFRALNMENKFKPPFRIGPVEYPNVGQFVSVLRANGIQSDLYDQEKVYNYYKSLVPVMGEYLCPTFSMMKDVVRPVSTNKELLTLLCYGR